MSEDTPQFAPPNPEDLVVPGFEMPAAQVASNLLADSAPVTAPNEALSHNVPNPEAVYTNRGMEIVLDTNAEFDKPEAFGIDSKSFSGPVSIIGRLNLGSDDDSLSFPIAKTVTPLGFEEYWLVPKKEGYNDEGRNAWIPIGDASRRGHPHGIGRDNERSTIDGTRLIGREFPDTVSRVHLAVESVDSGVKFTDLSTNGSLIEGTVKSKKVVHTDEITQQVEETARLVNSFKQKAKDFVGSAGYSGTDYVAPSEYGFSDHTLIDHIKDVNEMAQNNFPPESLEIMLKYTFRGKELADLTQIARSAKDIMQVQKALAWMYKEHPRTAETVIARDIVGVHGTSSAALVGILEHGSLLAAAEAKQRGVVHATGEHIYQEPTGQDTISFTTLADTGNALHFAGPIAGKHRSRAEVIDRIDRTISELGKELKDKPHLGRSYRGVLEVMIKEQGHIKAEIEQNPDGLMAQLMKDDFPVLFGISRESLFAGSEKKKPNWSPINGTSGDYEEVRAARSDIPLEEMIMAVPATRIDKVRKLLEDYGKKGVTVLPIEDFVPQNSKRI